MHNQKDNNKKELKNNTLSVAHGLPVSNYYNVFDHSSYITLATRSQKIVTAVYMITDFLDTADPMRMLIRDNTTHIMSNLFSLIHADKSQRVEQLSAIVNMLFANISYIDVIYHNGFVSDMNYQVVSAEIKKLQRDVSAQITKSLPYDKKENNNQSIRDFTFTDSFFGDAPSQGQKITDETHTKKEPVIKDTQNTETVSKKTPVESTVFVADNSFGTSRPNKTPQLVVKQKKTPKNNDVKSQRKENILKILKQKRNASINDICALFKDISSKTIQRDLGKLIDDGLVKKEGSRRWSVYNLTY